MQVKTQLSESMATKQLVMSLAGELDHHCAERLRLRLDSEIKKTNCKEFILDLSNVSFMDSSGLGVILGRYKLITQKDGTLYITGANRNVDRILRMSGIYSLAQKIEH